jgi:hypothetical protein|tara:strand:+ start:75 stop:539 length:465 start_codon:yes stop_codon:yes gene_type:complete
MHHLDTRIAAVICVVALFAASGCSQPKSGTYFKPEITARHDGFFSYDITFKLNAVNRIDWSRDADNQVTNVKTPVVTDLRDATLNVTVHYSQGTTHETQAFDAKWQIGESLIVNVPMTATIQGYDIKGTGYLYDESGTYLGTVPIQSSFRTTSE